MNEMRIEIPTQLIEDTIRVEMVRQIGNAENRDKLIESVVNHAMTAKKDNYNSTLTYFQEAVNDMIRKEALEVFDDWLKNNRENIRDALFKFLNNNKQKVLKDFCENLAKKIGSYGISIHLQLENDRG